MAKAAEFTDKGRRCHACNGAGWMQRYEIRIDSNGPASLVREVDFHDVCVGSWLMKNPHASVMFLPGEV